MTTHRLIAACTLAAATLFAPALAAPPTDEQVEAAAKAMQDKVDALRSEGKLSQDTARTASNESLEGLSIDEMTYSQIESLQRAIGSSDRTMEAVQRLSKLAASHDIAGAEAATLAVVLAPESTSVEEQKALLSAALRHPALTAALQDGRCGGLMVQLAFAKPEAVEALADDLFATGRVFTAKTPVKTAASAKFLYEATMNLGDDVAAQREALRTQLLAACQGALANPGDEPTGRLEGAIDFLQGAHARGMLINGAAPAMTILWSSDPAITSISDLKGRVVMIDFWATWCGPCIRAFPHMRELVERYDGYPVTILGVTSPQGYHIGQEGRVDTKEDPDKEFALMPGFIEWKNMTWPVVFTDQNVYNPDYGVGGIPHLAIIDPAGNVRYNALRPYDPMDSLTGKIDALLEEAHLPAPKN